MKPATKLESYRKAAILLVLLGEELSADVVRHLNQEEVEEISKAILLLGRVAPQEVEGVLHEFHQLSVAQEYLALGDSDYARKILNRAYGTDTAKRLMDRVGIALGPVDFDVLSKANPQQLSKFIDQEHPQTVALILAHLPASQAAEILTLFSQEQRADIAMRMAHIEEISQDIIQRISVILKEKLEAVGDYQRKLYGGPKAVAELFNRMDWGTAKEVLEEIEQNDANLAVAIRNMMFVFDDIATIDDLAIREILKQADKSVLGMALKGTSEQVKQRFFQNMSERAVELLKEDMEFLGAVKVKEVEQAQQGIIDLIRKLEEKGDIDLKGGGAQYVV